MKPLIQLLNEVPGLGVLGEIADRAGLAELIGEGRDWTVLAPTDAAFARLGDGGTERIAACPERARSLLARHVLPGRMGARALARARAVAPLDGGPLAVAHDSGAVRVGDAILTRGDVDAVDGVVHVIDAVLAA